MESLVFGIAVETSEFMDGGVAFCRVMVDVAVVQGEADDVEEGVEEGCWGRVVEGDDFANLEEDIERKCCCRNVEDVDVVDWGRKSEIRVWS